MAEKMILIIEPHLNGHHEIYLKNLIAGIIERGHRLLVATSSSKKDLDRVCSIQVDFPDCRFISVKLELLGDGSGNSMHELKRELAYRKFFRCAFDAAGGQSTVSHVLLPYLDYTLYACAALGFPFMDTPVTAIAMRPRMHHQAMNLITPKNKFDWVKRSLFNRLLSRKDLTKLIVIDETLEKYAKIKRLPGSEKIELLCDPVTTSTITEPSAARRDLGLPIESTILLLYGSIEVRKGLLQLLDGFKYVSNKKHLYLVIAGEVTLEASKILESDQYKQMLFHPNIVWIRRRITEAEEDALFSASNALWLGYVGHYSMSGVWVKGQALGKQMICCPEGLIGWHAARSENCTIVDINEPALVAATISSLSTDPAIPNVDFCLKHSWAAALHSILEHLDQRP